MKNFGTIRIPIMALVLLCGTLLASAVRETAAQQSTPTEQAMGTKILQEVQAGLTCNVNLISVQTELAKAQAKIKELSPKEEKQKE